MSPFSRQNTLQVSLIRADKRMTPQGYFFDAVNLVNFGYRHQLQPQLSYFLTLSNVFNGQRFRRTVDTMELHQTYSRQQPGRAIFHELSYVLNKRKMKPAEFDYEK